MNPLRWRMSVGDNLKTGQAAVDRSLPINSLNLIIKICAADASNVNKMQSVYVNPYSAKLI
jgi:hypothetical protein